MKQITAEVLSNYEVMPGVYLIWLKAPEIASAAKPGQFVMVNCGEDTLLPRPLSIHQCEGDKIALLSRITGKGTQWLSQCETGDIVHLFGTLGNGFSVSPDSSNLLLVAGGIGIAPLHFLAKQLKKKKHSVTFLYGTADKERYPILDNSKVVVATEDGSVGYKGRVSELIPGYMEWADQIFACGPLPMYRTMSRMPELKNKPVQVSLEVRMGCGRGICYGCTIKTKQGLKMVCEDGPIFDMEDILWDELKEI
ncbi:dihydroorotate dehydrogenase electron transfer subunit [Chloroflexota bacterium]